MKRSSIGLLLAATLCPDLGAQPAFFPASAVEFEPTSGQSPTRFVGRSRQYCVWLSEDGSATYAFIAGTKRIAFFKAALRGASPRAATGIRRLPSVTHIYGGPGLAASHVNIPHFQGIRFVRVYPGIDLLYRGRPQGVEYEFELEPGGDPAQIQWQLSGGRASLARSGDLLIRRRGGTLRHRQPFAYQEVNGVRKPVPVRFHLAGRILRLRLGAYDRSRRLVIDPEVTFSSYLGGSDWDAGYAVASDSTGNVYVTGETASANFPGSPAHANRDVFVTKMKSDGSAVVYTTILSSSGSDAGQAIAVDASGNAYVAGTTKGADFPVTAGAVRRTFGGVEDGFVVRLDGGGRLVYSTYLGSTEADSARGIAVDAAANAYVTGYTGSPLFPTTTGAPQRSYSGGFSDAFLVKINSSGDTLLYSTFLGGAGNDVGNGVSIDAAGNAFIAGFTDSLNLPVSNASQPSYQGGGDAFVASLNSAGTAWNYATYLGGLSTDQANAIAVDGAGNAYIAGATLSVDFPVTAGVFQSAIRGNHDAFVAKLSASGVLLYSTLLGGTGTDTATAIAVDAAGQAWVAGFTTSYDLPLANALQAVNRGSFEGFVAELAPTATWLRLCTYLGGTRDDRILGLALDRAGGVLLTGFTASTDFLSTTGALQSVAPPGYNGFVTRIQRSVLRIGIYRDGFWYVDWNGNHQWDGEGADRIFWFGQPGDIPVVGDWDGSGKPNIGVYRNGFWYVDWNGNHQWDGEGADRIFRFGAPGDIPVAEDWDGSGQPNIGVYRNGFWYVDWNGNHQWDGEGADHLFWFGLGSDVPVVVP